MIPRHWRIPLRFARLGVGLLRVAPGDPNPKRFVIVSAPRAGSTWLVDLLDSHLQITCFSELFAHEFYSKPPAGGNSAVRTWNSYSAEQLPKQGRFGRLRVYFDYLDGEIYSKRHGTPHVGFKLLYYQASRGFGIPAYLRSRPVSILHLIRRNHLDTILSFETRNVRSLSHAEVGANVEQPVIELDAPSLVGRLQDLQHSVDLARSRLASLRQPLMEIYYEDLLADPAQVSRVLDFLNVNARDQVLSSRLRKTNLAPQRELIANYAEIRERLKGTAWADLLR